MNSPAQIQESQSDTRFQRTSRSIKNASTNCFDCVINFCSNVWDSTCVFCQDVWDWTTENICYCCCDSNKSETKTTIEQKNRKGTQPQPQPSTTTKPNLKTSTTSSPTDREILSNSTVEKVMNTNTSTKTNQQLIPQIRIKPTNSNVTIGTTNSPTTLQNQKQITNFQSSSKVFNNNITPSPEPTVRSNMENSSSESLTQATSGKVVPTQSITHIANSEKQSTKQNQSLETSESPTVKILPPKIEFVETGSIFGDRKRPTFDQNMLQIENGRFRSPGTSKIVRGPGGRTIRVSFVSGFPAIKSIDSRSSLNQFNSKASRKSIDSQQQTNLTSPLSVSSLDSTKKQNQANINAKSLKSLKSTNSNEEV